MMHGLKHFGVYWPKMREDIYHYVQSCEHCTKHSLLPFATLFQVQANSKWGQHIVNFLQNQEFLETMRKCRWKSLKIEGKDFTIIGQKLYKQGKDLQL